MSFVEMFLGVKWLKRKEKIDKHTETLEFLLKSEKNIDRAHHMRQTLKLGMRLSRECQSRHEAPKTKWHNSPFEKEYTEFLKQAKECFQSTNK